MIYIIFEWSAGSKRLGTTVLILSISMFYITLKSLNKKLFLCKHLHLQSSLNSRWNHSYRVKFDAIMPSSFRKNRDKFSVFGTNRLSSSLESSHSLVNDVESRHFVQKTRVKSSLFY